MTTRRLGAIAALGLLAACSNTDQNAATAGAGAGANTIRPGSQEDLVANVGDRVFFEFDSSQVRADQRPVLQRQAEWMGRFPTVQVQVGHLVQAAVGVDDPGAKNTDGHWAFSWSN